MEYLKAVCEIYGFLSDVDKGHWDRLKHFYKKFSFKMDENHLSLKLTND